MVNRTSPFILISVLDSKGIDAASNLAYLNASLAAPLWHRLFAGKDCVDLTGSTYGFPYRSYEQLAEYDERDCIFCPTQIAFDSFATLLPSCIGRESVCNARWSPKPSDQAKCSSALAECNWNSSLAAPSSCFSRGSFCGVCENAAGFDCIALPNSTSASLCPQGVACYHNNGSWTWEPNAASCSAKFSCNLRKPNGAFPTTQAECLALGRCMDERFNEDAGKLFNTPGNCILPYQPWRDGECPGALNSPIYATKVFPHLFSPSPSRPPSSSSSPPTPPLIALDRLFHEEHHHAVYLSGCRLHLAQREPFLASWMRSVRLHVLSSD